MSHALNQDLGAERGSRPQRFFWAIFGTSVLLAGGFMAIWAAGGFGQRFMPRHSGFLVPSRETALTGFIQTATQQSSNFYRVNFRGRAHHSATVALTESRGDEHGKCIALQNAKADESTIPFQLSAGHGVVFTHSTALLHGGQIGWMQLLFDDQGSCVEISAKGLASGDLEPQDLILMLSSLRREPRS